MKLTNARPGDVLERRGERMARWSSWRWSTCSRPASRTALATCGARTTARTAFGQLDEEFRAVMQRLDAWFGNLERLAVTAFDPEVNNELLRASVRMAKTVGVPVALILRTTDDLDTFMQK